MCAVGRNIYLIADKNKPFSIINTENTIGEHWLSAYTEDGKNVYIYDSFARNLKRKNKDWYELAKIMNYKILFVNKKKDQSDASGNAPAQINCGLRSFCQLYCIKLYGIKNRVISKNHFLSLLRLVP